MTRELFEKDATHPFPIAVWKNKNFAPGQPVVQFGFGIGERSTTKNLTTAASWGILAAASGTSLAMAADVFQFNIVAVQFANIAQYGEIDYATQFAIDYLQADPNQIHMVNHSQSGYNYAIWASQHPDSPKKYATISMSAMGPGTQSGTAKALADSGRPIWFFTSLIDHNKDASGVGTNSGTSNVVTEKLYADVVSAGGKAWLTEYKTLDHNSVLSAFISAWGTDKGLPGAWPLVTPDTAIGLNAPKVKSWYDWILSNALNKPIRTPLDPPIVEAPYVDPDIAVTASPLDQTPSAQSVISVPASPAQVVKAPAQPVALPVTLSLVDHWEYPAPGKQGQQVVHTYWSDDPKKIVVMGPLTLDGKYRINGVHTSDHSHFDILCVNLSDTKDVITKHIGPTRQSDDNNWY